MCGCVFAMRRSDTFGWQCKHTAIEGIHADLDRLDQSRPTPQNCDQSRPTPQNCVPPHPASAQLLQGPNPHPEAAAAEEGDRPQLESDSSRKYSTTEYWNDRYSSADSTYDWHHTFETLNPLLSHILQPEYRVLVLGCGNSTFSEDMYDEGYKNIVNIDISPVCIDQMAKRNCAAGRVIQWQVMDVTDLDFEDNTFDMVIDKSTGDSISCNNDGQQMIGRMLSEAGRVLKAKGVFVSISCCATVRLMIHQKAADWKVAEMKMPTAIHKKTIKQDAAQVTFIWARKKPTTNKKVLMALLAKMKSKKASAKASNERKDAE